MGEIESAEIRSFFAKLPIHSIHLEGQCLTDSNLLLNVKKGYKYVDKDFVLFQNSTTILTLIFA